MFWKINTDTHSLSINLHVEPEKIILNESTFFLDDLKKRGDFRSFSRFVYPLRPGLGGIRTVEDTEGGHHSYPMAFRPFDTFAATHNSKINPSDLAFREFSNLLVYFVFYPDSVNFKDSLLYLMKSATPFVPCQITTLDDAGKMVEYKPDKEFDGFPPKDSWHPKCTMTTEKTKDGSYDITFFYRDFEGNKVECDFKASAKTSCGYLTHSEFNVTQGIGKLKFIPLGLSSGDVAHIQIGIGKFTDVAHAEISI